MTLTAASGESEGSSAEDEPGDVAACRGATSDSTSKDANSAEAGGRHGAGKKEWDRVDGRQENRAGKSSGVGDREGGLDASRVA